MPLSLVWTLVELSSLGTSLLRNENCFGNDANRRNSQAPQFFWRILEPSFFRKRSFSLSRCKSGFALCTVVQVRGGRSSARRGA